MSRQLFEIRVARPAFPGLGSAWTITTGSRDIARAKRGMFERCPLRWSVVAGGEMELRPGQMGPSVLRDGVPAGSVEGIVGSRGHRLSGSVDGLAERIEIRWSEERIEVQADGTRLFDVRRAPPDPRAPKRAPAIYRASRDGIDVPEPAALAILLLATPFLQNLT